MTLKPETSRVGSAAQGSSAATDIFVFRGRLWRMTNKYEVEDSAVRRFLSGTPAFLRNIEPVKIVRRGRRDGGWGADHETARRFGGRDFQDR